jgi:hypothetical protein
MPAQLHDLMLPIGVAVILMVMLLGPRVVAFIIMLITIAVLLLGLALVKGALLLMLLASLV